MADLLPGGDSIPYTTEGPLISAGQYVYIMEGETIVISSRYDQNELYRCHSAGIAQRDLYNSNVNEIRGALNFIKDRGTVFQDQYEEAIGTAPRVEDFQLNTVSAVSDPIDPEATITEAPIDERTMRPVINGVQPVQPMVGHAVLDSFRPLGAVLESHDPATGVNTTRLNNTADAIDPSLIKRMKEAGRFPNINRTQLEILKDLQDNTVRYNGQYLPCFGCEHSTGALFPGAPGHINDCAGCFRDAGRGLDKYIAKGLKKELYKQFAEEIVPVIKKQAIFEAKKRISEAEEKENKSKRTMVRIAKKRA